MDSDCVQSAYIKAVIRTIKFSICFDNVPYSVTKNGATGCPADFRSINNAGQRGAECLRVVSGREVWVSRFETMRYAAYLGATTELTKMEGFDVAPGLTTSASLPTCTAAPTSCRLGRQSSAEARRPD
jgi:hypothetical protein